MPFQSLFDFTHAITRGIPKSFAECAVKSDTSQEIDLSRAVQQMNNYISVLKQCGLKVITLPADEKYPDCLFVEDMAVVIGQKACLTQPGHPSRRGEVMYLFYHDICVLQTQISELVLDSLDISVAIQSVVNNMRSFYLRLTLSKIYMYNLSCKVQNALTYLLEGLA